MKKIISVIFSILLSASVITAQATKNLSVDISDDIYQILDYYQLKGLCPYMSGVKPYTLAAIFDAIDEILSHEEKLSKSQIEYLEAFKARYNIDTEKKNTTGHLALNNNSEKFPVSFLYDFGMDMSLSSGIYTNSDFNSTGFDMIPAFNFRGDITKYLSYNMYAFFDFTYMPLYEATENYDPYYIGLYWYEDDAKAYMNGQMVTDENGDEVEANPTKRTIKKFKNYSYLPYSYHKPWSGQIYFLSNLSASGLEGWATEPGISGGIKAEIRTSLFNNYYTLGAGRNNKEWAGMDNGSSLVLNANAAPFFEIDQTIKLFDWLHFSSMVGILEYPNQDYLNHDAFDELDSGKDDAMYFQNAFSINMIDLDWKYLHIDFGSNVIFPKRFELGYMFPLVLYVEYQNHIGDYDNMALFGDLKVRYPGLGSVWASIYFDELNIKSDWFTQTRVMFAGQLGSKIVLPFLPSATISVRYTKVEPYCYTHHAINYTPWYSQYISEAYVNGGEGLGYYLDPNSDEFFLRLDSMVSKKLNTHLQYQFIRHGADYGSQQVPGSSYYSEMPTKKRDSLEKYFLHDGAYNWMHIISLGASYKTKTAKKRTPLELSANVGFMYSYYTMIDSDAYDRSEYGNYGNCHDVDQHTKFHFVDTDEYPVECGIVLSAGLKVNLD